MVPQIRIGSDNQVTLSPLTDGDGEYVNSATVTGQLYDSGNDTIGSSFSMPYVSASDGVYRGNLPAAVTAVLTRAEVYEIQVTVVYSGLTTMWRQRYPAGYGDVI